MPQSPQSPSATRLTPATPVAVDEAARLLRAGGLVALPTETVYGLAADATNGAAVARIYAAKGRPSFNPLIAHVADIAAAERLARFAPDAATLARAFWPGPLTLVLPKAGTSGVSDLATAGLDSIALRIPDHPVARALLEAFGAPLVAPSANRSGHVSPTTAAHVLADLEGRVDLILDAGPTRVGVESTIVACLDEPVLLRPGGISRAEIERVLGKPLADAAPVAADAPPAPGLLASHYAPHAPLTLDIRDWSPDDAVLAFGPLPANAPPAAMLLNLSPSGDLVEAAASLFSHLRQLDASGAPRIVAMPVPDGGLGEAINDRLRRAAAPR